MSRRKIRVLFVGFEEDDLPFDKKRYDAKIGRYVPVLPEGYETVSWHELPKKTLYDYDVLLLDFTTLPKESRLIKEAASKREQIEAQLKADEGGLVIVFSCEKRSYTYYHNYDMLPYGSLIDTISEYSKEFRLEKPGIFGPIFKKYYKGQGFYFSSIPTHSTVFARNRRGGVLAFMYTYGYGKGRIVVLPEVSSKRGVLEFVIERVIPEFLGVEEPTWIDEVTFLDEDKLIKQRVEIDKKLSEYRRWKMLLYGIGLPLQRIVFEALQKMGLKVWEPEEKDKHDLEVELATNVIGVIEVTGSKRRINYEPLNSLLSYTAYVKKEKYPNMTVKGILIGNPEHNKPLEERDGKGFTDVAIEIAERNDFCLIRTSDLYRLLERYLAGELDVNEFKRMLIETKGLFALG